MQRRPHGSLHLTEREPSLSNMWASSSTEHGCCRTQIAHIHTCTIQPTCFCCCRASAKSIIHFAEWTVVPLLVKGSFQMAIGGDLKLTGQQNTAWTTKEFAFLGSTPNSVILMFCRQPLSLTSDSAQAEQDPLRQKIFPCPILLASLEPAERFQYLPGLENSHPLECRALQCLMATRCWKEPHLEEISHEMAQNITHRGLGRLCRANKCDVVLQYSWPAQVEALSDCLHIDSKCFSFKKGSGRTLRESQKSSPM